MNEFIQRDRVPVFHIGAGLSLFIGLTAARSFGVYDLGTAGNMTLTLFPALVFFSGQPRGRSAWLIAAAAALLTIAAVGTGVPALRWMAGPRSGLDLLACLAAIAVAVAAIMYVRRRSDPAPVHSPTDPKAWKPVSRWGVLAGLVLGVAVFGVMLPVSDRWAASLPDLYSIKFFIAVPDAALVGILAGMTVILCRPSDRRSMLLSILAGLAMAVLAEVSLIGGVSLVMALAPDRGVFLALQDAVLISAILLIPTGFVLTWALGRRPALPRETAGATD